MKTIPDDIRHWTSIKIFDERIHLKKKKQGFTWKKPKTPFISEDLPLKEFCFKFNVHDFIANEDDVEESYYSSHDTKGFRIRDYISINQNSDEEHKSNAKKFYYFLVPSFVQSFIPRFSNYNQKLLAPDLS